MTAAAGSSEKCTLGAHSTHFRKAPACKPHGTQCSSATQAWLVWSAGLLDTLAQGSAICVVRSLALQMPQAQWLPAHRQR